VLELTQYHTVDLARRMKEWVDAAIRADAIKPNEGMRLLAEYERGLNETTYLVFDSKYRNAFGPA
jgi:arginine decarboxylase